MDIRPIVIIYRLQLFKTSEPFIWEQVKAYRKFQAIFVGRKIYGTVPEKIDFVTLDKSDRAIWSQVLLVLTRNPTGFQRELKERGIGPALIHAHFGVDGVYALPLSKSLGVPLVITFHGFDATLSSRALLCSGKPAWLNYLLYRKKLAREGDLFICVSDYIRQQLLELGFPANRTITHYIGVDTQKIQISHDPGTSKIVLHVVRLVEKKGTSYLLEAFAQVADQENEIRLVIIGDGPLRSSLQNQVSTLGIAHKVDFLGALSHDDVLKWMHKSRLLVLPSVTSRTGDSEGLGIVLLEAAAAGLPVLATWHGGIPEAVVDGQTGFLVPERDVNMLAERLSIFFRDDNLCREMGRAARYRAVEYFDVHKQSALLESIYEKLL